ncbi:MAG TPA: hypothetical protein VEV63_16690 [Streptosporangiaceae bacterium]|nr:hypothetical protein [Streptosporangiaceae bacterium]
MEIQARGQGQRAFSRPRKRGALHAWHWHGAAADHFMSHLSITEAVPGDERPEPDWGEHVTDAEYNRR